MSCNKPLVMHQARYGRPTVVPTWIDGEKYLMPCGQCLGCRIAYSTKWTGRILLEAKMHEHNWFTTLTYSDEKMPWDLGLHYSDVQLFHKRLAQKLGQPIRHVNVGEYSDVGRPHWHAIHFGMRLDDLRHAEKSPAGEQLYMSETVEKVWGNGRVRFGEVTQGSARYLTDYALKDVLAKHKGAYDEVCSDTGLVIVQRALPKLRMSRNPGIASSWFEKYGVDTHKGFVTHEGKKIFNGDYFMRKLEEEEPEIYAALKEQRKALMKDKRKIVEQSQHRLDTKEAVAKRRQFNKSLLSKVKL